MLKLSKKIDYGLLAINYMASHQDEFVSNTKQIAEEFNIPVELLAKVLQRLAKKGLINSVNGPKGGYMLAKDPTNISVAEVVEAIEGPIRIADCYKVYHCLQIDRCSIRTPIERIQASIIELLGGMTLAQMNQTYEMEKPYSKEGVKS
jgi:Rrf2 family transcriptional regulator, cysteine metabolism repressor